MNPMLGVLFHTVGGLAARGFHSTVGRHPPGRVYHELHLVRLARPQERDPCKLWLGLGWRVAWGKLPALYDERFPMVPVVLLLRHGFHTDGKV